MTQVYGTPANPERTLARWLRRGTTGLAAGRSEAAAPVGLSGRRATKLVRTVGVDGANGLPGASGMDRGAKAYARADPSSGTPSQFGVLWATGTWGTTSPLTTFGGGTGPIPHDLERLVRGNRSTGVTANTARPFTTTTAPYQMGQGNGRGGFRMVYSFGFTALPSTRRWFVGVSAGTLTGDPSSNVNLLGVGQDSANTSPRFMHNDAAGAATSASSGLADVTVNRLYEVAIFADPMTDTATMSIESFVANTSTGFVSYDATLNLPAGVMMTATATLDNGAAGGNMNMAMVTWWAHIQPLAI